MYKPNLYVNHVSDINYEKLKENGIKLLCIDIDNTLDVPDRMTTELEKNIGETLAIVNELGFEVLLFSNNSIENRVASFAKLVGYPYVAFARKPFQKNYKNNEIISKYQKQEIAFIGDKIVTDIIGAKRFGSYAILVDPLCPKNKKWYSIIMQVSERIFTTIVGFKRGKYYGS